MLVAASRKHLVFLSFQISHEMSANRESKPERCSPWNSERSFLHQRSVVGAPCGS
jgi:hypothetical protein